MLHHLTSYLLQYKQVCLPHVGTLQLVQGPPVLNVADKRIEPPSYVVERQPNETLSNHQLSYLHKATRLQKDAVENELRSFGECVKQKIDSGGYHWEGLGVIESNTQSLLVAVPALQAVGAEKIIRQDAAHKVLVGDREMIFEQNTQQNSRAVTKQKRSVSFVIGWALLLIALFAVAVLLYLGKFNVTAAGSKLSPTSF